MSLKSKQAEGQDRNVYNTFKRFIRDLNLLSPEQLAEANFEIFHEARMRGAMEPD